MSSPSASHVLSKPTHLLQTATRRSGSAYGSGDSSTARMTEKIAVVAPIPRASVRIAAAVNPGARRIPRKAYRMSWMRISTSAPFSGTPTPRPDIPSDGGLPERFPGDSKRTRNLPAPLARSYG